MQQPTIARRERNNQIFHAVHQRKTAISAVDREKPATSVPWYVVSQEAMMTKVECDEGCEIAPRNNQQKILHCITRRQVISRHCDTRPLIARRTTMIVSFMSCCKKSNNNDVFDVASSGRIAREPATTVI